MRDFDPAIAMLGEQAPSPLPRFVLWTVIALVGACAVWIALGRRDVVAVAEGRLVPRSQLKTPQAPGLIFHK